MKIPDGYIPKGLYTENPESVQGTKSEKAEHHISQPTETIKHTVPQDSSNVSAKKAELAMSGQAQAAALQRRAMGDGSVKDLQRQINEYRHGSGLSPIKEDGMYGPETQKAESDLQSNQVDLERLQSDASNVQIGPGPTAEEQMLQSLSKPGKDSSFEEKLGEEIKKKLKQL
jgi:hypothetical protein